MTFISREFRVLAARLDGRIAKIKDEAVSVLDEPPGTHHHRIGRLHGILEALAEMSDIEKTIYGDHRS